MNVTLSNSGLFYAFVHCILRELKGSRVLEPGAVQHIMRNFWHRESPAHFLKDISSLWNPVRRGKGERQDLRMGKAALLTGTEDKAGFAKDKGLHLYCVCMRQWARRTHVSLQLNWQILGLVYGGTGKKQNLLRFVRGLEMCEFWKSGMLNIKLTS